MSYLGKEMIGNKILWKAVVVIIFIVAVVTFLVIALETQPSNSDGWIEKASTPKQGGYGEALVGIGNHIYVIRSWSTGYSSYFWRYDPLSDNWMELKNWGDLSGAALAWDYDNYIYTMFGGARSDTNRKHFYRYEITSNSWEQLQETPHTQGAGDALTWCGYDDYIYAMTGSNWPNHNGTIFARYNPNTNLWEDLTLNPSWENIADDGASLVWTGGEYLYALRGEYNDGAPNGDFARYHIPTATWEDLTPMPEINGVCDGASLLWIGYWSDEYENCIFALGGGNYSDTDGDNHEDPGYNFYCYYIDNNTWQKLENIPYPVGEYVGNRLGFAYGNIYYWQGTISTWDGGNKFCQWSLTKNIPPVANFTFYPSNPTALDVINFINLCYDPDGYIVNYTWNFGDGSISYERNPKHGYATEGTYNATLRITDDDGATNTISKQITISKIQYTLTISVEPNNAGYIELNPLGGIYDCGTVVTLIAYANEGYEFSYWGGDISSSNETIQIVMDSNKTIIAHFVAINQPPTITITYPLDNQKLSGIITIKGETDDDVSVEKVEIKIDNGKWVTASGTRSWYYRIDTGELKNGYHIIYARSYDGRLYSEIASVNVTIFNNLNKPCIVISKPEDGSIVKEEIAIQGKAWDIDGDETIEKVEIKIGDEWRWYRATGEDNWTYPWNTKTLESNGYYTIYARAWDGEKYSEIYSVTVFVNNLIHLQIDQTYRGFVTPDIPQGHWTKLYENGTYEISVDPAYFGDKADFKLEIVNLTKSPIDENAKGFGEEYTFKCNKTDNYYIKVYSDIDADYYLAVREIHQVTKEEMLMLLGLLGVIVAIAFSPVLIDFLHQKIRKVKLTMGRRIIFSILDFVIGVAVLYVFFTQIYNLSKNPSLKNAFIFSLSVFIYPVYKYLRRRKT